MSTNLLPRFDPPCETCFPTRYREQMAIWKRCLSVWPAFAPYQVLLGNNLHFADLVADRLGLTNVFFLWGWGYHARRQKSVSQVHFSKGHDLGISPVKLSDPHPPPPRILIVSLDPSEINGLFGPKKTKFT